MGILSYPFLVASFWYKEGLFTILAYFQSLDDYCIRLFSIHGLFVTFFKPLKNEYRKNLVLFSVLFGMVVKLFLIIASLIIFSIILSIEALIVIFYLAFPFLPFVLLLK